MEIRSSQTTAPKVPPRTTERGGASVSNSQEKDSIWDELFSGELNEIGIHLNPEYFDTTIDGAQSLGEGLAKTWNDLGDKVGSVFDFGSKKLTFSPEFRARATEIVVGVAKGLGYTAAGVQGLGGAIKLVNGFKENNLGKKLDGVFDMSTAAAVATTVAGLGAGPLVLVPLAASMGIVKGSYTAGKGFLQGNGRKEIQGALDATRSASVGLRLAAHNSLALGAAGTILGGVAGAIQITRGVYDLSNGVKENKKDMQVRGLTDIASAAGLTLALTGVGTIPGIAITAVAMGTRLLYQFNDRFEGFVNRKLDEWNPGLTKTVNLVDRVTQPVIKAVRGGIESLSGHFRGEQKAETLSKSEQEDS